MAESKAWMIQWAKAYRPDVDNYAILLRQYDNSALEAYPSQRMIGTVGVIRQPPELGYMMHPDFWGKGYASEAVQLFLQFYWQLRPDVQSIIAKVDPDNVASIKILVKNGFREEEVKKGDVNLPRLGPRDMIVYRLTRGATS